MMAFGAGAISATGFAPLELWPVTIAAFALWMWLVADAPDLRAALARGWWFGLGHFVVGMNWIAGAFRYQDTMPVWLGYVAVVTLSLYLAIYPAVAAGLAWRWGRVNKAAFVLLFAAAWIVTEYLRSSLFTGFAWNPLGVVWVGWNLGLLAKWIGTYGLSGLTILIAGIIGQSVVQNIRWLRLQAKDYPAKFREMLSDGTWPTGLVLPVLIPVVVLSVAIFPLRLIKPQPVGTPRSGPIVRVIQPNIGLNEGRDLAVARAGLETLAQLSGPPGKEPRLLFWPEAALNDSYEIDYDSRLRADLASLLGPRDLLITGGTRIEYARRRSGAGVEELAVAATNSVFILDGQAKVGVRYDKAHLVPYGEYLPMRPLLSAIGLSRLVPGDIDFRPGPGPKSITLPGFGKIGVQICYEIIFSGHVADRNNRPDFLFNPSNDAWFGNWGPPEHLAQARLRAIEEGLPVIRSTPTGISAVIDSNGAILVALPMNKAGFIQTRLPPPAPPTLFARFGNILPLAFALTLIGFAVALRRWQR
jgi:apolipoprotein N-acyltransferase